MAIAVLPFQNLSAAESNAYLASGLHDELLTQLARVAALTVMGRTSVLSYAGTTKSPSEIARELSVRRPCGPPAPAGPRVIVARL